jgi:hypothetical protein
MEKKPVYRSRRLEESVAALCEIQQMFLQLETTDVLRALTAKQKTQYQDALSRLRDLIQDLWQQASGEQLVS